MIIDSVFFNLGRYYRKTLGVAINSKQEKKGYVYVLIVLILKVYILLIVCLVWHILIKGANISYVECGSWRRMCQMS